MIAPYPLQGGCDCGEVRYQIESAPLFVHCCHCRWCQRESGSAFALNALIEAERVILLQGAPEVVDTPSASGKGQLFSRCARCKITLWSTYASAGPSLRFMRVGALDMPDHLAPDTHIFTSTKQPWVILPDGVPAVPEYYQRSKYWPADSIARVTALREREQSRA